MIESCDAHAYTPFNRMHIHRSTACIYTVQPHAYTPFNCMHIHLSTACMLSHLPPRSRSMSRQMRRRSTIPSSRNRKRLTRHGLLTYRTCRTRLGRHSEFTRCQSCVAAAPVSLSAARRFELSQRGVPSLALSQRGPHRQVSLHRSMQELRIALLRAHPKPMKFVRQ